MTFFACSKSKNQARIKIVGVNPVLFTALKMTLFIQSSEYSLARPSPGVTNNPTSGNTPGYKADTESTGTSTAAVYLTKSITLENSSTSLDVRLASNVRSSSSVKVYFRVLGAEQDEKLEELAWTPFNTDGSEDTTVTPAEDNITFKEYQYSVDSLKNFTSFQIKITMTGSISSYPPKIKDMRAIALAI